MDRHRISVDSVMALLYAWDQIIEEFHMARKVAARCNSLEPILLSLRDASSLLHIAIPTLRRWLRQRRLAHVRCGRAVRIEAAEVRRFIARNRRPASDELKENI